MIERERIKSFTDLDAWKKAHQLSLFAYKTTEKFPDKEKFGLSSQMRRAAVSIASNIAEGFSRSSAKDKEHFYVMARSSLTELQSQFLLARDLEYFKNELFLQFASQSTDVSKLVIGLMKSAMSKKE